MRNLLIVAALFCVPLVAEEPIPSETREAFAFWTPPELAQFMGQPHDGKIRLIACTNTAERVLVQVAYTDATGEQVVERELKDRACATVVLENRPLTQLKTAWRFFVEVPGPAYTWAR